MAEDFVPDDKFVPDQAPASQASGDFIPDSEFESDEDKYSSPGQQTLAALEGVSQGALGPVVPYAEKKYGEALGYSPETIEKDIRGRKEHNPLTHATGEAVGFVGPAVATMGGSAGAEAASLGTKMAKNFTLPGLVEQIGNKAVGATGLGKTIATQEAAALAAGSSATTAAIKAKIAAGAIKIGTEMAAFQAADEATKYIISDPEQSAQSALANVGLAAGIGIFTGGALKAGGIGVNAALEKTGLNGTGLKEFTDRLAYRGANAHPEELVQKEFSDAMESYHAMNDEVTGATGLRSQAISKALPEELTPAITDQVKEIGIKADEALVQMHKNQVPERYQKKFINDFNQYLTTVTDPAATVADHFDALNELKKTMQGYSKGNYGPFAVPSYHDAYDFLNITKNLGRDLRLALEDSKAWGEAAGLQKDLNSAWSKILPSIKDAQSKFMSKINGEYVMDPTKIRTYLNQNGKSTTQNIRQQMMGNFVDSYEKYQKTVDGVYSKLGLANPHPPTGLGALKESLEKVSPWAKAADLWYDKMVSRSLGESAGAATGAAMGHATGIPGAGLAGAYIGKQIGENILPSIIQPMLEKTTNLAGFQQAVKYGQSVLSGQNKLVNATKAVFGGAGKTIPANILPDKKSTEKLDSDLKKIKENPEKMFAGNQHFDHYMPKQAQALAQVAQNAVSFLNSIRPENPKANPLDADHEPTKEQVAGFNRALEIAQQPISIMQRIKDGTILPQDIKVLNTLYPKLYTEMSRELITAMSGYIDEGKNVPYTLRQSISMFLATPLDSTMTPASIIAAQSVFIANKMQQAPQQNKTDKLSKVGQQSLTKSQATEVRNNRLT